ncbi:MAG: M28 family peptidase [Saprospiraceae bacterium]|nr:M28 family peptidase [Saprospiraceae bacterium]
MKFHFFLALFLFSSALFGQNNAVPAQPVQADPAPFAQLITPEDMKTLIDMLAAPDMQGRETGQPGQQKAADYIASQFKAAGLPTKGDRNSYFQQVLLQRDNWKDIGLKVAGREFKSRQDFYVYPAYNATKPKTTFKEVVFVGYGIDDPKYSDYGKTDVAGKAVIFYDGEPLDKDGKSLVTGNEFRSAWSLDWRKKVKVAKQKGATMVFIVDPKIAENLKTNKKLLTTYGWKPADTQGGNTEKDYINSLFISPEVAAAIMGKKAEKAENALAELRSGDNFKAIKLKSDIEVRLEKESSRLEGVNVVGVIEGSDEKLKKEYVFITAHYDHLGMSDTSRIFYGADDNASGTAAVIEIAKAFAEAKKQGKGPKRTVVCMLVCGEEKGLLGSKFYVEFPLFPLDKTVVDINIDMIGRVDERHANNPDYVYVIGSDRMSTALHQINEDANKTYTKMELDYRYNAKDDPNHFYERSDHYNFAERGIPAIFYFNGTHPDYHKTTDTPDKINHAAAAKRAQLAFYTAWEIANRPIRLPVDVRE